MLPVGVPTLPLHHSGRPNDAILMDILGSQRAYLPRTLTGKEGQSQDEAHRRLVFGQENSFDLIIREDAFFRRSLKGFFHTLQRRTFDIAAASRPIEQHRSRSMRMRRFRRSVT